MRIFISFLQLNCNLSKKESTCQVHEKSNLNVTNRSLKIKKNYDPLGLATLSPRLIYIPSKVLRKAILF